MPIGLALAGVSRRSNTQAGTGLGLGSSSIQALAWARGTRPGPSVSPPLDLGSGAVLTIVGDMVRAVRVHGTRRLRSVSGLHTAELPHCLVWITAEDTLAFGPLELERKLHWRYYHWRS